MHLFSFIVVSHPTLLDLALGFWKRLGSHKIEFKGKDEDPH